MDITELLKKRILQDIGLPDESNPEKAQAVRAQAANVLQGTIGSYAQKSHPIAMPGGDTHFIFAKIRDIAQFGEQSLHSVEQTKSACSYVVGIMIDAYNLDETKRRQLYAAALIQLTRQYPLRIHNFEMPSISEVESGME